MQTYSMSHEALGHVIFAYSVRTKLQRGELSSSPTDFISVVLHVYSSPALLLKCLDVCYRADFVKSNSDVTHPVTIRS